MLFDLYYPRISPHFDVDPNDINKNYSHVTDRVAHHSEIARPEYNYVWNSDCVRSIEFSTKPRIVALGCSITLGQGMPENLRWTDLLSNTIGEPIGNISYSGGSIARVISSFFGMLNQYKYNPEIVICNFPNFERFYFIDSNASKVYDYRVHIKKKVTKATAPWDYETILPYEWAYFQNLEYIKMLEVLCESAGIKLIWSTWSNALSEEKENFLKNNFRHYTQDPVRKEFPDSFEFMVGAKNLQDLAKFYEMYNWNSVMCHKKYKEEYSEIFDYAYDYHQIPGPWGDTAIWPHPGLHKHLHWSDFYYYELNKRGWI